MADDDPTERRVAWLGAYIDYEPTEPDESGPNPGPPPDETARKAALLIDEFGAYSDPVLGAEVALQIADLFERATAPFEEEPKTYIRIDFYKDSRRFRTEYQPDDAHIDEQLKARKFWTGATQIQVTFCTEQLRTNALGPPGIADDLHNHEEDGWSRDNHDQLYPTCPVMYGRS